MKVYTLDNPLLMGDPIPYLDGRIEYSQSLRDFSCLTGIQFLLRT